MAEHPLPTRNRPRTAGGQGEDGGGSGWPGWPGRRRPWDSRGWANYDLFPDELYAKDLKRGALALRDFSTIKEIRIIKKIIYLPGQVTCPYSPLMFYA